MRSLPCRLLVVSSLCASSLAAQDADDGCPDIVKLISESSSIFVEADTRKDGLNESYEIAKDAACDLANLEADFFLAYEGMCWDFGCIRTEAWWEWCGDETQPAATAQYCYRSGNEGYDYINDQYFDGEATKLWICSSEVVVHINAYATCEPEQVPGPKPVLVDPLDSTGPRPLEPDFGVPTDGG